MNFEEKNITKQNNEIAQQTNNLTLKERLQLKKSNRVLILDISASMNEEIEPGRSKITALREIVNSIPGNPPTIAFNNTAIEIDKSNIPNPRGGTMMTNALILAKSKGFKNILMITDGDASDKRLTLLEAEGLNIQIMYVGCGPRPKFLDELGSSCTTEDLRSKELGTKIQLLLGSGGEVKSKTIIL